MKPGKAKSILPPQPNDAFGLLEKALSEYQRKALLALSPATFFDSSTAVAVLRRLNLANGDAPDVVDTLLKLPIWRRVGEGCFSMLDVVREKAVSKLNGQGKDYQHAWAEEYESASQRLQGGEEYRKAEDFAFQSARLRLRSGQEIKGVESLREKFDLGDCLRLSEYSRLADLFLWERFGSAPMSSDKWPSYIVSAMYMRAMYAYRHGKREAALGQFELIWRRGRELPECHHDAAVAAHLVGNGLMRGGRWKATERAYKESLQLGVSDQHHLAQVHHSLGNLYTKWGKYKEAETEYKESLGYGMGDRRHLAQVHHSCGNLYTKWRKYKEAEAEYKESLGYGMGDRRHLAQVHHSCGNLYTRWGKYKEAEAEHKKSLEYETSVRGLAQVHHSLGNLYTRYEKYEEAEVEYKKSLEYETSARGLAQVHHSLGNLYTRYEKYEEAEVEYKKSLEHGKNDYRHLAQVHNSRGKLYVEMNRLDEAKDDFVDSLKYNRGDAKYQPVVEGNLKRVFALQSGQSTDTFGSLEFDDKEEGELEGWMHPHG